MENVFKVSDYFSDENHNKKDKHLFIISFTDTAKRD